MKLSSKVAPLALLALALAACGDRDGRTQPVASSAPAAASAQVGAVDAHAPVAPAPQPQVSPAVATETHEAKTVPASDTHAVASDAHLTVKRLVVARGVEGREPQGASTAFWQNDFDRLYAFVELKNPDKTESKIVVSFVSPSGKSVRGNVTLTVGATARFRTWAYSRAVDQKGTWNAVVSTVDGRELARQSFDIL